MPVVGDWQGNSRRFLKGVHSILLDYPLEKDLSCDNKHILHFAKDGSRQAMQVFLNAREYQTEKLLKW
jgi:hypothetical protein